MRDVVREEIDEVIKRLNFNNEQITEVGQFRGINTAIEVKYDLIQGISGRFLNIEQIDEMVVGFIKVQAFVRISVPSKKGLGIFFDDFFEHLLQGAPSQPNSAIIEFSSTISRNGWRRQTSALFSFCTA